MLSRPAGCWFRFRLRRLNDQRQHCSRFGQQQLALFIAGEIAPFEAGLEWLFRLEVGARLEHFDFIGHQAIERDLVFGEQLKMMLVGKSSVLCTPSAGLGTSCDDAGPLNVARRTT